VDLTTLNIERDVVERLHAGEGFGH
jgi:hypothetical protein